MKLGLFDTMLKRAVDTSLLVMLWMHYGRYGFILFASLGMFMPLIAGLCVDMSEGLG